MYRLILTCNLRCEGGYVYVLLSVKFVCVWVGFPAFVLWEGEGVNLAGMFLICLWRVTQLLGLCRRVDAGPSFS